MKRLRKGQSVLEYIIVLTAIVAAVVAGVLTLGKQNSSAGLGKLMYNMGEKIKTESQRIADAVK